MDKVAAVVCEQKQLICLQMDQFLLRKVYFQVILVVSFDVETALMLMGLVCRQLGIGCNANAAHQIQVLY